MAGDVKRICLLGAESTGKTTLAHALADAYATVWNPEYGRPWAEAPDDVGRDGVTHGAVFLYEALAAGTAWRGVVLVEGPAESLDDIEGKVRAALKDTVLIGRSRRSGYGGVATIEWLDPTDHEVVGTDEQPRITDGIAGAARFRVTLLSDAVLRDETSGQIDPAAAPHALLRVLGGPDCVEFVDASLAAGQAGGYNRTWRLPLQTVPTVRAGSVFVFKAGFAPPLVPLIVALFAVPALTVVTGFLMSRGVMNHPPLAILRSES